LQFTIVHPLHEDQRRLDWHVVEEGDGVPIFKYNLEEKVQINNPNSSGAQMKKGLTSVSVPENPFATA
jgi:hypothetical protein